MMQTLQHNFANVLSDVPRGFSCSLSSFCIFAVRMRLWVCGVVSSEPFVLRSCFAGPVLSAMVKVVLSLHPQGLHPLQAAKAHRLRAEGLSWADVVAQVKNLQGQTPAMHAVRNAVARIEDQPRAVYPQTKYENCGRRRLLSDADEARVVGFVKKFRNKHFCTCRYIKQELRLAHVSVKTIARCLNRHGFHWRAVPKQTLLSDQDLEQRKSFVAKYEHHTPAWWERHMGLVLDGVTLTMAPPTLSGRQKHAAQRIERMWLREGERCDRDAHTFNRYGIQLGTKVPLWGGFTGSGHFTLRMWTPRPKMTKAEWEARVPTLKRAADAPGEPLAKRPKVWHDNEKFLLCPKAYAKAGLEQVRFPANSGDLNPIETVWARLRRDLAKKEQEDLKQGRVLKVREFRIRVATILRSYEAKAPGQQHNYYQKLARGMPGRLAACRRNRFGRCGK